MTGRFPFGVPRMVTCRTPWGVSMSCSYSQSETRTNCKVNLYKRKELQCECNLY
uniref:Uncharacterized protein n=1 Tax=Anguilla anguilla TaxID=7936 RepID=A0A0E9R5P6_ANGAN